MPPRREPRARPVHRHLWLIEPLTDDPTLLIKPMFGGKAIYRQGRFVLYLADKAEPWRGVLVPTEHVHQASLRADRPALVPHPILPKWLYLPEVADSFETDAQWLVAQIRQNDARVGIVPPQKRGRRPPPKPGPGSRRA